MAVTTMEPPNGVQMPPVLPKRAPGRPPKQPTKSPAKQELSNEDGEEPPIPLQEADGLTQDDISGDFWLGLKNLVPSGWEKRMFYLIRLAPSKIESRSGGRPAKIATLVHEFDADFIKKSEGSGCYRLDCLFQTNGGKWRRYRQITFDILDMDYPPRVPYGAWIDLPENEAWKWAGPMILARQQQEGGAPVQMSNGTMAYAPGFNVAELVAKLSEANDPKRLVEVARMLQPPPKDETALTNLVTKLIDISFNKAEPKTDSAMALVVELLRADLKESREEMRELRKVQTAPPPAQKGIIEQVKELRPVLSEFVDLFEQKTGNQPWWAGPLEKLMDGVGEAIPTVVEMMKTGQQQQQNRAPAPQWNTPPAGIPAPQTQAANPPPPPPPNATSAAAPPDQPEMSDDQKRIQAIFQKWGGFVLFIWPQISEHFKIDRDGEGGLYFRDWFLRMHGELKWAELRKDLGPEGLAHMIAQHPVLSQEMAPEQARKQFFVDFFEEPGDDTEEEEVPGDGVIDLGGPDAA